MKIIPSLTALLALTVTLTACKPDTVPPSTADLTITLKNVGTAHVKVANTAGEVSFDDTITGSKTLTGLKRGSYTVMASNTDTHAAPATQTADLSKGNTTTTLEFSQLKGSLLLQVDGVPSARVVIKDAAGKEVFADTVTGSKTLGDLPYGTYTVIPQSMDGQVIPATQAVVVKGAATATLTYNTVPAQKANLTVSISGVVSAPVTVKQGDKILFEGVITGSKVLSDLPRGDVTVTAGVVDGFTSPATQTVDLNNGTGSAALIYSKAVTALDAAKLQGQIINWPTLDGLIFEYPYGLLGNIPASGKLDLALPTPPQERLSPQLFDCDLKSSNPASSMVALSGYETTAVNKDPHGRGNFFETPVPNFPDITYFPKITAQQLSIYLRIYSTAATTLSGSCFSRSENVTYLQTITANLTLQAGWNIGLFEKTPQGVTLANRTAQPLYLVWQAEPTRLGVSSSDANGQTVQLPKHDLTFNLSLYPHGLADGDYALSLEGLPAGTKLSDSKLTVIGSTQKSLTLTLPSNVTLGSFNGNLLLTGPAGIIKVPLSFTVATPAFLTLDFSSVNIAPGGNIIITGKLHSGSGTLQRVNIYLDYGGNTSGLELDSASFSNVTETGQDVSLKLSASINAAAGQRDLKIVISTGNLEPLQVPLKVNVLSSLALHLDNHPMNMKSREAADIRVAYIAP